MGLFRTSQGLGIPQICLVVGETGVKWTYFEGPDPRNDPIWGLKPRIWTSGDPKMDHFETTFGPLLVRPGSRPRDPNNGEMRDFGLFRPPEMGSSWDPGCSKMGRALGVGVRSSTTIYLRARA